MKTKILSAVFAALFVFTAAAQQEDPVHQELRTVRDGLLAGMNKGDIDAQLVFLHPNVVVTWHDAEVSRGRAGVKSYLDSKLHGASKVVEKFGAEVKVDELSILYGGDTAVAFGSANEHFTLTGGRVYNFTGRWSATLVKEGGQWLIVNLQMSDNMFDNPLLNAATGALWWAGGGCLAVGLFVGWLIGRRRRRA